MFFRHIYVNGDVMKRTKVIGLICVVGYCFVLKFMFRVVFPFAFAIICYFVMKPLIDRLAKCFHIQKSAIGVSLLLVIYLIMAILLGCLLTYGVFFMIHFFEKGPMYYEEILLPFLEQLTLWIQQHFPILMNEDYLTAIQNFLGQSLLNAAGSFSTVITQIPVYLFSFFLFIISTFFFMLDYEEMKGNMLAVCSQHVMISFVRIKNKCLKCLWVYVKCQLILMSFCFFILFIGFTVMRMSHPLLYAFITSLLDCLPFIGVGIVLIPLCVVYLLQGTYLKAFYIFLTYLIINVVRSLLEPRIMNKQMKIPSFLLLLSMMVHLYFFGMIGVILSPIHMSLIYGFLDIEDENK